MSVSKSRNIAAGIALLVAAFAVYWPALGGAWLWDDNLDITENPLLRNLDGLAQIWFQPTTLDYYPLKFTVQWIQWQLWGDSVTGYHVTNVLLHAYSGILVTRVFGRLGIPFAWWGGLIFVVHPLAVESVAWIAELKNTLSLPPLLLALLAWLDFEDHGSKRARITAVAWFLAAMLCKSSVVMFPVTLLLFCWWRRGRISGLDLKHIAPFFAVSLVLGIVTLWLHAERAMGGETLHIGDPLSRLALAGSALAFYTWKALWPVNLLPIYPQWSIAPLAWWHFVPWAAMLALLVACYRSRATWGRPALFGIGWFVLHLLPVVGFVTISFMRFSWVMDHFSYVALPGLIGLSIAAADRWSRAGNQTVRRLLTPSALLICMCLGVAAREHASRFRDPLTFWNYTVSRNPAAWVAHNNLGLALANQGDASAARAYEEAVRLNPQYFEARMNLGNLRRQEGDLTAAKAHLEAAVALNATVPAGHYNLALVLIDTGAFDRALTHLNEALRLKPRWVEALDTRGELYHRAGRGEEAYRDLTEALRLDPNNAAVHFHLGSLFLAAGQPSDAVAQFETALGIRPDYAEAHNNLGTALVTLGRLPEAIQSLERAVAVRPNLADARLNLGLLLSSAGRPEQAAPHFEAVLARDPTSLKARFHLGNVFAGQRRYPEAAEQYRRALELDGNRAEIHAKLAVALLATGQTAAARTHYERARALDPATPAMKF